MNNPYQPVTMKYTIVYDSDGNEINRLDGHVAVSGKDYADRLPISYRHIIITTETITIATISKP